MENSVGEKVFKYKVFKYKGYYGSCEYSEDDQCWYGKILDTDDLILYEGQDIAELKDAFQDSVEAYIEFCQIRNLTDRLRSENDCIKFID